MMNVNKQQRQIVDFFSAARRFWGGDENVKKIQEIYEQRMIQLLELFLAIEVLWIQSPYLLAFEWPNYGLVIVEVVSKN
jgi:hypothetical protein